MRRAFINALCRAAAEEPDLWLLTGDLGYNAVEPFAQRFPDRFVNVGIAEQNMASVAAGLALSGNRVFIYSIANFATIRCAEQIRNDICQHQANVTIVGVGGGFAYGRQGYSHHALEDLAIMRALPGMTVVAPGDPVEVRLATLTLARQHRGPAYLRLGKSSEPTVHRCDPDFAIGRAIPLRLGRDVTIITTGAVLPAAFDAARTLCEHGCDAGLISMPTVKPMDRAAIEEAACRSALLVTIEEHSITGGLAEAVAPILAAMPGPCARFMALACPDHPPPHPLPESAEPFHRDRIVAFVQRAFRVQGIPYPALALARSVS